VKRGEQAPDGWVKINDRIADVYFPEQALSVDLDYAAGSEDRAQGE
jgi:hypothetical protein